MVDLLLISIVPVAGGWLACRLWHTRPPGLLHTGLAVGQIPRRLRRRRSMAVRREVAA